MNSLWHGSSLIRRISWSLALGSILLASFTPSLAEEITLTTYYPSPRGVYDELQANIYRDLGDPANRFLDPTATSQLQDLTVFGGITLAGRTIQQWEDVIPAGGVLVFAAGSSCPAGFTKMTDYGRTPVIAATPGATGGDTATNPPDALTSVQVGGTSVASAAHRHTARPPYREFVFCQRN